MVTYTTVDNVKNEIQNYDTSCTDGIITVFIENAEGLMNSVMGEDLTGVFDSSKTSHLLLRLCATKLALIDLIKWDLQNQFGSSVGSIQLDLARETVERCLTLLSDKRVVKFIKGEAH